MLTPISVSQEALAEYNEGVKWHQERCLNKAKEHYREALRLHPAREPGPDEESLILRHAPRVFTTPTEPLPLMDFAAILHPELPIIGYHFFFEDDIDFPGNGEPCDHEICWVQLDDQRSQLIGVYTYYHSVVLPSMAAVTDAAEHEGRARIEVQWGKHGLLPYEWEELGEGQLTQNMRGTYERLHTTGCRNADYPVARSWPHNFAGTWGDFIDFSVEVDPRAWLERNRMIMVGNFANAIIDWYFLRYNFRPKFSWPDLEKPLGGIY